MASRLGSAVRSAGARSTARLVTTSAGSGSCPSVAFAAALAIAIRRRANSAVRLQLIVLGVDGGRLRFRRSDHRPGLRVPRPLVMGPRTVLVALDLLVAVVGPVRGPPRSADRERVGIRPGWATAKTVGHDRLGPACFRGGRSYVGAHRIGDRPDRHPRRGVVRDARRHQRRGGRGRTAGRPGARPRRRVEQRIHRRRGSVAARSSRRTGGGRRRSTSQVRQGPSGEGPSPGRDHDRGHRGHRSPARWALPTEHPSRAGTHSRPTSASSPTPSRTSWPTNSRSSGGTTWLRRLRSGGSLDGAHDLEGVKQDLLQAVEQYRRQGDPVTVYVDRSVSQP